MDSAVYSDASFLLSMNSEPAPEWDVEGKLRDMWRDKKYVDVVVRVACGDSFMSFPSHRLVLSLWSPLIAGRLQAAACEDVLEVDDVAPSAFGAMLKLMYGLRPFERQEAKQVDFVLKVYQAARLYGVVQLEEKCRDIFDAIFPKPDNVFSLLQVADLMDSDLKERCYNILQTKTAEILKCNRDTMSWSNICTVLDLPCVNYTSAAQMVHSIMYWVDEHLDNLQLPEVHREILQKLLPDMLQLEPLEFVDLFIDKKDFFDEKDAFCILMNIVKPGSHRPPSWYKLSRAIIPRQYRGD